MTDPVIAARYQYDRARRAHERQSLLDYRAGRVVTGTAETAAARRLARYGPSETIVVKEIG